MKKNPVLIKNKSDVPGFLAGDHTEIQEILHPKNDFLEISYSLALATLEPGKCSLPHILHNSSELYIIVKGKGRVFIDQGEEEVGEGQIVFIPKGVEQWIENIGDSRLEFYCIVSPPWSEEQEEISN